MLLKRRRIAAVFASVALLAVRPACAGYTLRTLATLGVLPNNRASTPPARFSGLTISGSTLYGRSYENLTDFGSIFSVPLVGGAATTLTTFSVGGSAGYEPTGPVIIANGLIYGTTESGANGQGAVFSLPVSGGTPTPLANSFRIYRGNGEYVEGGVTLVGNTLYGTLGSSGAGASQIFSVPVTGGMPTTLANFSTGSKYALHGDLIVSNGTVYGTSSYGGSNSAGFVFSVPLTGGPITTLATFNGQNGANPIGGLLLNGNTLYGTTYNGGSDGDGTVFSLPIGGGNITTLATFDGTNGGNPACSLILSGDNLFGTTYGAVDPADYGTVFSLTLEGGALTTLATFAVGNGDTGNPWGGLVADAAGNLYGTGCFNNAGQGTVFELSPITVPEPGGFSAVVFTGVAALGRRRRAGGRLPYLPCWV